VFFLWLLLRFDLSSSSSLLLLLLLFSSSTMGPQTSKVLAEARKQWNYGIPKYQKKTIYNL
jgi:hypothetical protein